MSNSGTMLSGPVQMHMFHMLQIKHAMRLEQLGMKHSSGKSAHALAKRILGIKGNKQKVYEEFCKYVESMKTMSSDQQG